MINPLTKSTLTTPYQTQSHDELRKLPVTSWADRNAHLYAWAPNTHIEQALALVKGWGFEFKTLLVWRKDRGNPGRYFFMSTEVCLFAVRGRLSTRVKNLSNVIDAPRSRHSEKPSAFYDLVQRASYGPYLDIFARRRRPGWATWGNLEDEAVAG